MASALQTVRSRIGMNPVIATLVLLIALNLLNYIDRYILPGELSLIQREFHSTDQQMGALTTALFFFYMIAAPLTGWLGDWFPRKPLIIAGAVLWSLATLATAWVHDYTTLYIRHALVGVGEATFGIFAPAVLADFYPERDRNRILSIFYLAIPVGAALGYLAGGQLGPRWGWRAPFFLCAIPGLVIAALYGLWGREPQRGASDRVRPAHKEITFVESVLEFLLKTLKLFTNPAYLTATFGLATLTFAMGGISAWVPEFLSRSAGLSVGNASLVVGAITVIDGIAGTIIGGWIAQRWLRSNHRALYLLSFWSVALTLPCGALLFFGPRAWAIPSLFAAEFFLFLNTGPLNAAIVNSVSAPVRATAIACNLFIIHCFGDTFSPQIIGAISDHSNLRIGLGATLIFLVVSCIILRAGARFALPLEEPA
ncbi:MAG: MFS transporter [Terracidiphilus sp.]|jgi:MFS family permease